MEGVDTSGQNIGRYRLLEKIGEGGMGVVHLATDAQGRRSPSRCCGRVSPPTRPPCAVWPVRSTPCGGCTARTSRRSSTRTSPPSRRTSSRSSSPAARSNRPCATVARCGCRSCRSWPPGSPRRLAAIHGAGIIHRDLKPGNVMFLDSGEPVVIDFGIAQGVDATPAHRDRSGHRHARLPRTGDHRGRGRRARPPTCTPGPAPSRTPPPAARPSDPAPSSRSSTRSWRAGPTSTASRRRCCRCPRRDGAQPGRTARPRRRSSA